MARAVTRYPAGTIPFLDRFWAKVIPRESGCWEWTGTKNERGYGYLNARTGHANIKAHRLAWMMATGTDAEDGLVLHRCDNPPCVNPSHLYLGDNNRNVRDMYERGREWRPSKRSTCRKGHPMTPENTYLPKMRGEGWQRRVCRTCERIRQNASWPTRKARIARCRASAVA